MRGQHVRESKSDRRAWLLAGLLLATAAARLLSTPAPSSQPVECPAGGQHVAAGTSLQSALDEAATGAVLCLSPGAYGGPLVMRTPVRVVGTTASVIRSSGQGSTIRVLAPDVSIEGVTIDGSGDRLDTMDAAVYVGARDVAVRDVTVRHALFGLVAERTTGVRIEGNHVIGNPRVADGLRGDGIRLWEVDGAVVTDNVLEDVRDMVIWYSPNTVLEGNTVRGSRYAAHFMYANGATAARNRFDHDVVGVFVMYSSNITLRDNVITDNTAVDGMGVGVKDSGSVIIERNELIRDRLCLYIDHSPFGDADTMTVRANMFALCDAGVTFHSSETRTMFEGNRFEGNGTPVAVEGRGSALGVRWHHNYFDDYRGYDADGDGVGDVPYELHDASERLIARRPALAFFRGTPALAFIDAAAEAFPVLRPETLLVDDAPRMRPPASER